MTLRVLIVGAGIAGLALARALRLRGIAAEVVERTAKGLSQKRISASSLELTAVA